MTPPDANARPGAAREPGKAVPPQYPESVAPMCLGPAARIAPGGQTMTGAQQVAQVVWA